MKIEIKKTIGTGHEAINDVIELSKCLPEQLLQFTFKDSETPHRVKFSVEPADEEPSQQEDYMEASYVVYNMLLQEGWTEDKALEFAYRFKKIMNHE